MKKRSIVTILMLITMITCSITGVLFVTANPIKPQDFWVKSDGAFKEDSAIAEGLGDITDARKGLLYTTSTKSRLTLASEMSGIFDIDFLVYSNTKGVINFPSDTGFEPYKGYINELNNISIEFTDTETGEMFDMFMQMGENLYREPGGSGTMLASFPNSSLRLGHEAPTGDEEIGKLTGAGGYVPTSFCNRKNENNNKVGPSRIRFDPSTKIIEYMYGTNWYNLIDFDDPSDCEAAGASAVTGFNKYSVAINFTGIRPEYVNVNNPAKMLIYSLNGQSLAGSTVTDKGAPGVNLPIKNMAVLNHDYTIPTPIMYDLVDGYTSFNGNIDVYYKTVEASNKVTVTNNKFNCSKFGNYIIRLSGMRDLAGNIAPPVDYTITTKMLHPGITVEVSAGLYDGAVLGQGTNWKMPTAVGSSQIVVGGDKSIPTVRQIIYNGEESISDASTALEYTFDKAGVYQINYIATDYLGVTATKSFIITIDSTIAVAQIGEMPEFVDLNEMFAVPSISVVKGTTTLVYTTKLYYPDGAICASGKLDRVGKYRFVVSFDGGSVQKEFIVKTRANQILVSTNDESDVTVMGNVTSPDYAYKVNGIGVTTHRNNAELKYTKTIDLNRCNDKTPIVEFLVTPPSVGEYEFNTLHFKFTDIYDKRNFMEFVVQREAVWSDYFMFSAVRAGAKGNFMKGKDWNGKFEDASGMGTSMTTSFYGIKNNDKKFATQGAVYFDNATKIVSAQYGADHLYVINLAEEKEVGKGKAWDGFKTGEVTMTVSAEGLNAQSASFMLLSVAGQPLSGEYLQSAFAPKFKLPFTTIPEGIVGKDYPIPSCDVVDDIDGVLSYDTVVTKDNKTYPITNRKFTPDTVGKYKITFTTGKHEKVIIVNVKTQLDPITYTLDNPFVTNAFVGQKVSIPKGIAAGGSGEKSVTYNIKYADGDVLDVSYNKFIPTKQGALQAITTVTDYLGQTHVVTSNINITLKPAPIIELAPSLPMGILANKTFNLPKAVGYYYTPQKHLADCDVTVNGVKNTSGTIDAKAGETYAVKYRLYGSNRADYEDLDYVLKVATPLYKEGYFVNAPDVTAADRYDGGIKFKSTTNRVMGFVRPLPTSSVTIDFAAYGKFSGINIMLADSLDRHIAVKLSVRMRDGAPFIFINDVLGGQLSLTNVIKLTITGSEIFNANGTVVGNIITTVAGEAFSGFSSGYAYMNVEYAGVDGSATFELRNLCGQAFDDFEGEFGNPIVTINGVLPLSAKLGDVITVPTASCYDILDPESSITVTVKAPNGDKIFTDSVTDTPLSFTIDKYDRYSIIYTATDSSGNSIKRTYSIMVYDLVPPEITFSGEHPTSGTVNKQISLPKATVTDNHDKNIICHSHYTDPTGNMVAISDSAFTPTMAGTYIVSYFASDSSFSYVRVQFIIEVTL